MNMKIVHKHEININQEVTSIELPEKSNIVSVEYLNTSKTLFMWVEVPADLNAPKKTRNFRVFKTGDGIPEADQYIATGIDQHEPEAYHVYEIPE